MKKFFQKSVLLLFAGIAVVNTGYLLLSVAQLCGADHLAREKINAQIDAMIAAGEATDTIRIG